MNRHLPIVIAVLGFHALGLWTLGRASKPVTDEPPAVAMVMAEWIREEPVLAPPEPPTLAKPLPASLPTPQRLAPSQPLPAPRSTEPPTAVASNVAPSPSTTGAEVPASPATPASPVASASNSPASPVPATTPGPAQVEQPSSSARYLNNPKPAYPKISNSLGEQGQVVVRVLIDTNGLATQANIHSSSGFERLDQAALKTVLSWRYVPGKRNGIPEAMWFNVPIQFVLE